MNYIGSFPKTYFKKTKLFLYILFLVEHLSGFMEVGILRNILLNSFSIGTEVQKGL